MRKQDDFYSAINGEWEKKVEIPDDKSRIGSFNDLSDSIEKLMLTITDQWQAGENLPQNNVLQNFIKLHRLAIDQNKRNVVGLEPVKLIIKQISELNSFSEYVKCLAKFEKKDWPNAMPFGVAPDFKNASKNVLWAYSLDTILPDTTYYLSDNEKRNEFVLAYRETTLPILMKFGYSKKFANDLLDKNITLDARIARYVLSNEEKSEYAKFYHSYQWEKFVELVPMLPMDDFIQSMIGTKPDVIIVPEENFWQHADQFYSEEAWPFLKAHLLIETMLNYTDILTDELRIMGGAYGRIINGISEPISTKKAAYYLASRPYNQALGLWYAHNKFSPAAKKDVEVKVKTMIDVYKNRLKKNTWLTEQTRYKAIKKLNSMVAHIGYPNKLPQRFYDKVIDENKSLFDNFQKLSEQAVNYAWSKWNKLVDKTEWHMPAHMVNAYYDPQQNQIVFPAAILQSPFYDLNQSTSSNYGGIGAVIAHEISHAFDTNGALFDENGNLNNWWLPADYLSFEKRIKALIKQFDGLDSYGAKVNGKLTISENVADLGGLTAALTAAKRDVEFSAEEFFINWAIIWRMKARPEFMQMMANVDVHGPAKLRVNVQVANFDDFFQAFNVQKSDNMWRDPNKRIQIW